MRTLLVLALALGVTGGCSGAISPSRPGNAPHGEDAQPPASAAQEESVTEDETAALPSAAAEEESATFAAGCFWCTEAVLEQLDGVLDVSSGYMGGDVESPTYRQVCTGSTGHAEVVQVTFDPSVISYDVLLGWFWRLHDPTTLNRQGADVGTQYRSAIFVHSDAQRVAAERSKAAAQADFSDPIVTEITAAGPYYPAESYHQDYYRLNARAGYCQVVIAPKLNKLGLDDRTGGDGTGGDGTGDDGAGTDR